MHTMISQTNRALPPEWTDTLLIELWNHARDLGHNGNPGGYILTAQLFPFVGRDEDIGDGLITRELLPYDQWNYDGMRHWIRENEEEVLMSWQREVKKIY